MPPPEGALVLAARGEAGGRGGLRTALRGAGGLLRLAYRDPEHVPERLSLFLSRRQGPLAREWAERTLRARPGAPRSAIAEELRDQSAQVARIDGAVAGTPFFIALVPGYMAYLQQEARMTLRMAALYGRDPTALRAAAELLALRGVHPTAEAAEAALLEVRGAPMPEKPSERRPLRTWVRSVYLLLVFGGFLSARDAEAESAQRRFPRLQATVYLVVAGLIWVTTWVLPVTFMIVMAWGCESHTRQLGRQALALYGEDGASVGETIEEADRRQDEGHDLRTILRSAALALSVAVPIVFVAYVDHVKQSTGLNWLAALGALVALSLVLAITVIASRK